MNASRPHPDDALRAVKHLADFLAHDRAVPEDSRKVLREGLQACIDSSFELCLFTAIGLKSRGGVSLDQQRKLSRRDTLLINLWQTCDQFYGLPPIAAAKLMHLSAERYQQTRWPRERYGEAPSTEPEATWWLILSEGGPPPKPKRLQQILQSAISGRDS